MEQESSVKEEEKDPRKGLPPSVTVVTENTPMTLQTGKSDKGPWIQYNGIGTVRIMDKAAWKEAGVESDKYVQWNYLNHKRVPRSLFNDQELQYLLRVDGRFSLETEPLKKT